MSRRPAGGTQAHPVRSAERGRLLRRAAWSVRGPLALSMAGAVVRQAGFLAAPFVLRFAIDDGVIGGDLGAAAWWAAVVLAAGVAQFLGMCVWDHFANLADARTGVLLRTRLRTCAIADSGRASGGTGDLVIRAGRDVDLVRVWVHGLPTWVVIAVTVGVLVPGLASLDPWLLVVAGATVPCLIVLAVVYPRRFERASMHAAEAHGRRADAVDHLLRSAVTVRGAGMENTVVERHARLSADLSERTVRAGGILARWTALGEGIPAVATAVGVVVAVFAVLDGRLTVGGLVTFSGWMATVGIAVQVGLQRWTQSADARVGAARLQPVLDAQTAAAGGTSARRIVLDELRIFPEGEPIALTLEPGRLIGLSGPTGSGKSTLLRVMAGIEAPHAGRVLVDGAPPTGPVGGVHLVPQRPLVLNGTVRENLALGAATEDGDADDARYRRALATVGLDTELASRSVDALDASVGEGGGELSGGQVQRLALARALVVEPAVLLLDDVTSAVDATTGARIIAAITAVARERIVVVAGHGAILDAADAVLRLPARTEVSA
ncbi:ABC transporter ATP-binding protein [Microbacterium oxydans]|uniref:ATP-binding cassette domain-containing protein n=1 Tax=Microbacterium TaxID=33882 RepID=UPI0015CA6489|nr:MULTISPECIES: ABC transporter ATP-binding protein [unclassified Microbacterium]MBE7952729.1 ABC transporter ATP-binding protein [Microbacterium sp. R1]NYF26543.1 ATP-binding cassette subfamily B protein [Microbacterium sp. JAI119]